jgi:hypothetical protein
MFLFIGLALFTILTQLASAAPPMPAFACIDELNVPVYPPIAHYARVSGEVSVRVVLTKGRTVEWEILKSDHRYLSIAIKAYLDKARFTDRCGTKSFILIFRFRISNWTAPSLQSSSKVALKAPNIISITTNNVRPTN